MKFKFKIFMLLTALLTCFLIASAVFADNLNGVSTADQGGDVGNGVKWHYDGKGTTTFSYSGSGSGEIPNNGSRPWRTVKNETVFLRIESGITRIGDSAFTSSVFRREKGWKNLYMADTVKTIGNNAFYGCFDICTFRFSKNLEEIGDYAFVNPSAMTFITIPSKVKKIGKEAFKQAFSLRVLTFEVPKPANYHDLDIGKNAFQYRVDGNKKGTVKIAYTSETGILVDRNTGKELPDGAVLPEDDLSNRALTWVKHTPTNYIVTYDPNGGRMTGGISTVRVPVNSTIKLHTQSQLGLTYIGKNLEFRGWATKPEAKRAEYKDGAEFTPTDDTTLYAVWKDSNEIAFDANGGSFTVSEDDRYMYVPFGESVNLKTEVKLGLTPPDDSVFFVGWSTTKERADSTNIDYVDGAKCTPTDDMRLYAVWKPKPVVTYDPNKENGGKFASGDETIKEIFQPGVVTPLTTAQKLKLENISDDKYFIGWSTAKNGSVTYEDHASLKLLDNITLYAVWVVNGDGETEDSPFIIDSYKRLKQLQENTNSEDQYIYFYNGKHFKLTVDIDTTLESSENWAPIGSAYNNSFNGHFNGGNHFIQYKINESAATYQGLFGYLDGGSIKNLSVQANIKGKGHYVGGIVGCVGQNAVVRNCYATSTLESTAEIDPWSDESTCLGGIAGSNLGTVEYCSVFGSLLRDNGNDDFRLGGIVGVNNGGTISNCTSFASLGWTEYYAGMITGDNQGYDYSGGTVLNCYYDTIMAGNYKGVGYDEGTKDESGTTPMTRLELAAYANGLGNEYSMYREGILQGVGSGGSDEDGSSSSTSVTPQSSTILATSGNADKVLTALKKASSAISGFTSENVYDLDTARESGEVSIGSARTSADISEDDKNTIGDAKYIAVLPEMTFKTSGVYVFSVTLNNMPAGTPIVFHHLKQTQTSSAGTYMASVGEVSAAVSDPDQNYIFLDKNANEITTVPERESDGDSESESGSSSVNVAGYFTTGTYAPVIAGSASDGGTGSTGSSKGSSSGCNAGFGVGLAALLLVPFVKKIKFRS